VDEPARHAPVVRRQTQEDRAKTGAQIMSGAKTKQQTGRYFELVHEFPLRRLRNDGDLTRANAMIKALIVREKLTRDEEDYLDVLGDLVEAYEDEHHPLPPVSEADMLRHLLESRDVSQSVVSAETGIAESTLSSILAGRRRLNRDHIAALAQYFKVSPAVFISTDD
jgi:HTH-type transcriptional regulator/antitoxin HigA